MEKSVFFPLKTPKHLYNFKKLVLDMQNVRHIAQNAGHTVQNDGRTMQFVGRTTSDLGRNTLNFCQEPKVGGLRCPPGPPNPFLEKA